MLAWCSAAVHADVDLPHSDLGAALRARAEQVVKWRQGEYDVWVLRGNFELKQGAFAAKATSAVIWVDQAEPYSGEPHTALVYLEGKVDIQQLDAGAKPAKIRGETWVGRLRSQAKVDIDADFVAEASDVKPAIFARGEAARVASLPPAARPPASHFVQPAQFNADVPPGNAPAVGDPNVPPLVVPPGVAPPVAAPPAAIDPVPANTLPPPSAPAAAPASPPPSAPANSSPIPQLRAPRRVIWRPRSGTPMSIQTDTNPQTNETIVVISNGVLVVVEGLEGTDEFPIGKIDIEADRVVIWTSGLDQLTRGQGNGQLSQPRDVPLEFYLEGNIVFRESDRVIYADRMYYNVTNTYGMVLGAEVLTPVPEYRGLLRLKADVLQQFNRQRFEARGAALTSSRLGVPEYWVQAEEITFEDRQRPRVDPLTGQPLIDPQTGEPAVEHDLLATSRNNFVYLYGLPVFYWPYLATDLRKPNFYIDSIEFKSDNVFGQQLYVDFDIAQLLGIRNLPFDLDWTVSTDYLSNRGFALGTNANYNGDGTSFGGPFQGSFDAWGINDTGLDNLGRNRRRLVPPDELRGRLLWQHRHYLGDGLQITAEAGWLSDRNFLEQYFEKEWDTFKDQTTGVELKQLTENGSWSIAADVRLNEFVAQTEWLPRFDHYLLGQSLLFDRLTWHAHTNVGYARFRTADLPPAGSEPAQASLPWETDGGARFDDRHGLRAASRHELDLPLQLGGLKVVPYVLGEAAYWQEDRDETEVSRLYGQVGVRSSLPFWSVNPTLQNPLFNLNGLAHKVTLESEVFYADANRDLDRFPLYDAIDDDSQEAFRRRLIPFEYGGVLPARYDPRTYALRSGMQNWVSAPSTEIADDLFVSRLGVHQRWQTKRGLPGQERIVDFISLDVDGYLFPEADRDNFGESAGLLTYDFRWQIGDRVSLLSDGFVDVFPDGLRKFTIGGKIQRPEVGDFYLGYRRMDGPFSSDVIMASLDYRMSEKWIVYGNVAFDLSNTGNIGEQLSIVRIGESLLIRAGVNIDHSRNNVGAQIGIEPRFLTRSRFSRVGGVPLAPAGAWGLE